jgi:hypothetical protein
MHESSAEGNKPLYSTTSQEAFDALEKYFSAPLAEEGEPISRERSEHILAL